MKKLQYWTLRSFLICMLITALFALTLVWSKGPDSFGIPNQIMISSFVVGFASFLIWFTTIVIEIKDKLQNK